MKKYLVIYYTRSGNTKKVASTLTKIIENNIEELIEKKKYKGFIGFISAGFASFKKKTVEIGQLKYNPKDYEEVVFMTPIWASNIPPTIRTYIKRYAEVIKSSSFIYLSNSGEEYKPEKELSEEYKLKVRDSLNIKKDRLSNKDYIMKLEKFFK